MGIPKIKSATAFRENLYETLKDVTDGNTYVVTQKEGKNIVLISQEDFNVLLDEREVLRSISLGISDLEEGKKVKHQDAVASLRKLKNKWK